ncbi:protein tyrosine phosphatase [Burkholderia ubonensis]|uniref:low molecular weight protein-tyrosine-phosphatase n=1 Tax=Burkholderia ubonensis TaxID=101571 RepID=UPI0007562644|nr:low molecular weight protein-tyrosine-phosphatase [Burkholderia ubonensis]KVO72878.1 protein tyrosine phosphatase [Burkholderia ubonensis]KVP92336.1 protein tyrosine phosphatase [Burkholderia ubonensis]OJB40856.1 protein tyrosine phosphatase [Burkholderia ubonensis]
MRSILVVCVGNICRSPMAEGLLRERLKDVEVRSAGLDALVGKPADNHSIELMEERGIDIRPHRARQLGAHECRRADLILAVEDRHRRAIEHAYPFARGRVFTLGHYGRFDIADPFGQERRKFEECLEMIEMGVDDWVQRIRKLS